MGIASGGAEVENVSSVSSVVTASNVGSPVINLNLASEDVDNRSTPTYDTSPTNVIDQSAELSQSNDLAASVGIGGDGGTVSLSKESEALSDSSEPTDIISKFFDSTKKEITTTGYIAMGVVTVGGIFYLWKKYKKG